jgi:hypothetical protein
MADAQRIMVSVERLFLDTENPRFLENAASSEADAIELLCKEEQILELAEDIVAENSIDPLQLLGVIPDQNSSKNSGDHTYVAVDGNRRLCALKLLIDPQRAPAHFHKRFKNLAEGWTQIDEVFVMVFQTREESYTWIQRAHGGTQKKGVGRRSWNAEQSQRFGGGRTNKLALKILDYAQKKEMITEEERKNKITTTQRYINKKTLKEILGINGLDDNDEISITRPTEDFEKRLMRFMRDLAEGKIDSRTGDKKEAIDEYARKLESDVQISGERTEHPIPLETLSKPTDKRKTPKNSPRTLQKINKIHYNSEIHELLEKTNNDKLKSLYHSICSIKLEAKHVPLLAVGVWTFVECLSSKAGRKEGMDFPSYYSKEKLKKLEVIKGKEKDTAYRRALERVSNDGNLTKHHKTAALFNGEQLANDMETLNPLIIATCKDVLNKKK